MTKPGRVTFTAGPFKGVRDTTDPYDDPPDLLVEAVNCYIPDPGGGSGVYARPGFPMLNNGNPIYTSASAFRGQGVISHTNLDGSTVNFIVMGGHLFRVDATLSEFTDVTPGTITIDPSISTRVYGVSCVGKLVISDSVNRPWIASDLDATPITGTYIDYDGNGVAWSAFGRPTLYQGGVIYPLNQVNGVSRRTDVSWSEPGLPDTGFQQAQYDNNWTIETSSASPIYAVFGTNTGFYYWRSQSIGVATGILGPNLASSSTEDTVSFNVGTRACQTIQQFGDSFFFCDAIGRPWRFVPGQPPEPIWLQMRAQVAAATIGNPAMTSVVATSVIEPTLNLYLVGIWSPTPSTLESVTRLYAFDARTGTYLGYWEIGQRIGIDCIGSFTDSGGRVTLIVLGTKDAGPAQTGYVWAFNSVATAPQYLTTEDPTEYLFNEDLSAELTTEGQQQSWMDNGLVPLISAKTGRFGYEADTMLRVDRGTLVTLNNAQVQVAVDTASVAQIVQGLPTPSTFTNDGTYRLTFGCDIAGRGPQITVAPQTADDQWSLQSVSLTCVASNAGPEDL